MLTALLLADTAGDLANKVTDRAVLNDALLAILVVAGIAFGAFILHVKLYMPAAAKREELKALTAEAEAKVEAARMATAEATKASLQIASSLVDRCMDLHKQMGGQLMHLRGPV